MSYFSFSRKFFFTLLSAFLLFTEEIIVFKCWQVLSLLVTRFSGNSRTLEVILAVNSELMAEHVSSDHRVGFHTIYGQAVHAQELWQKGVAMTLRYELVVLKMCISGTSSLDTDFKTECWS